MLASQHGNTSHVTSPVWGESTGHWWIPTHRASNTWFDVDFYTSLNNRWSHSRFPVIWDAMVLMRRHGNVLAWYLTHWGRDKMADIFPPTFSNGFSWMKMYEFRLIFHWSLFLGVQLTIFQHWFRLWLGAVQATSHYLNQCWLVYRRIYASLGLNELKCHDMSAISLDMLIDVRW